MDINQALQELNTLMFPAVTEGDNVRYKEFWFLYQNDTWVIDETKNELGNG